MEQFSFVDIFASKGVEYIFVISFLIVFIVFWKILDKKTVKKIKKVWGILSENILKIPQGLFYSKNQTWVHMEKSGLAKVGVNDLLQHLTGVVNLKSLKKPGEFIDKGDILTQIEQNGKNLIIHAPISGKIENTNESLISNPELLNQEPYDQGWVYSIKPSNWKEETSSLYFAEEATEWVKRELKRFKDFLAVSLNKHSSNPSEIAYQDGGELIDNTLSDLPKAVWEEFQREFLN